MHRFGMRGASNCTPANGSPPEDKAIARELAVMRLVVQGLTERAIARRLGISVPTVRRRTARFRRRMGAETRLQAVAIAVRRGLLDPCEGESSD